MEVTSAKEVTFSNPSLFYKNKKTGKISLQLLLTGKADLVCVGY